MQKTRMPPELPEGQECSSVTLDSGVLEYRATLVQYRATLVQYRATPVQYRATLVQL